MRDLPGLAVHVTVTTSDARSAQQDVTLSPGAVQEIEVALQPLSVVTGRLLDSGTRLPVAGASMSVEDSTGLSGADGRFTLRAAAGNRTLRGYAPLYRALSRPLTAASGQPVDLGDVPIEREKPAPGTIGVQLRGDSETPPTVVYVMADGPADHAGVRVGDQIAAVDGTPVTNVTDATQRNQGSPGSAGPLTLQRSGPADGRHDPARPLSTRSKTASTWRSSRSRSKQASSSAEFNTR